MPLVRLQVRNEFGLGQPELYREVDREDPNAVLDGVAVAGLVGILRQLGHLVDFAVEVFHGLQEQVMSTSSRSHKLMVQVQRIEAALPPLEKAMLAQKSHLRFAYATGSDWHALLQDEQNHFIYGDLPQFIMDSYEECCDPPRLHLLDKFDTGGPGSCLKRYSDPTFFRKASASFGGLNVEKVPKDRKDRRSKKERSWQRNEMSHGESISNHTGSTQLASLKVNEQISPPLSVSTFDGTLKSDLEDQSNSFDLRSGSGYIECVFHPSDTLKPEEHEPKESSFSILRMQQNNTLDSASFDEHRVVGVDFSRSLLQGETGPSSSCVTWDEKTEIIGSWDHQYDHDATSEMLTMIVDVCTQEREAVNFRNVGQMDFQFDNKYTPISVSGQNQVDDIESEPGNYMDAHNIVESESETDLDCQMKQVLRSSNFNDDRKQDRMQALMSNHSDLQSSNLESLIASYNFSNNVTFFDKPDSISSTSFPQKSSTPMETKYSNTGKSLGMDFSVDNEILDGSRAESDVRNLVYSGSADLNPQAPRSDKIISTCESQGSPCELSTIQAVAVKCWTNGGLLGLEPSKPPDFSVSNAVSQDSVTRSKDDTTSSSSQNNILNCDGYVGMPDKLVQNSKKIEKFSSEFSASCHTDQDGMPNKKTSWRFFPTELDANHEKYCDSHCTNSFYGNVGDSLKESSAVPEAELAANPDVNAICSKAGQTAGENACKMLGLSNRFLVNGSQKNGALVHDGKSEPPTSRKSDVLVEKSRKQSVAYRTVSERNFKGYLGSWSPINSSPPFQQINGFKTSKIKLKFPDGSYCHYNIRDTLPSFQLVPGPATPRHGIGSVSDDDTFCRSSPYVSDGCLTHNSESNSEQREYDDSPPSKGKELYDALRRISLTESVSSSVEPEGTGHGNMPAEFGLQRPSNENCMELCRSGRSLELPSFSTLNPLFEQEMKNGSDGKGFPESQFPKEPTPLPPPLPPLQWRVMKHHSSDAIMGKQDSVSDALSYAFDMKILGSIISPQSKLSPVKQQQNDDVAGAFALKDKSEWQKSNGNKEVKKAKKGKDINEMEDFLHQIRTRSFSLRRAVAEKPTVMPQPTANFKITTILQKANAIRQAVASDGEDDSWSDI